MVKISCLDDAFSETFKLKVSPIEGQSLPQKDKRTRQRKGEKSKSLSRPKFLFVHMPKQKCCKTCC